MSPVRSVCEMGDTSTVRLIRNTLSITFWSRGELGTHRIREHSGQRPYSVQGQCKVSA